MLQPAIVPTLFNESGRAPLALVCDHAANHIPAEYTDLGLKPTDLQRHIAWDIGALGLSQRLAMALGAPLAYPNVSRLLLDCNRDPYIASDSIPQSSEDTIIPGNAGITEQDRARRIATIYEPFHALAARMTAAQRVKFKDRSPSLIAVHSFTPIYRGYVRPWDIGIIIGDKSGLAEKLIAGLKADASISVGVNEPYSANDNVYHTLEKHGVAHGWPTAMIEVRQDHLSDEAGQAKWALLLSEIIRDCIPGCAS